MKLQVLNRKVHYWVSVFVALPIFVIAATGLLLQLKKQLPWVQPPEQRGSGTAMTLSLPEILEACRRVPQAEVRDWSDIQRVDVRPSRGMLKVWTLNNHEIQLDAGTGAVLQVAYRRSDVIESIHDGSWFHDWVKFGWFLPTGVMLLGLAATGLYLFWLPIGARRRRAAALAAGTARPSPRP